MLPLAVSGKIVIGAGIVVALALLFVFFRAEDRIEAKERSERERNRST